MCLFKNISPRVLKIATLMCSQCSHPKQKKRCSAIYCQFFSKDYLKNGLFCEWCTSYHCRNCCPLPQIHQVHSHLSQAAKEYYTKWNSPAHLGGCLQYKESTQIFALLPEAWEKISTQKISAQEIEGRKRSGIFIKSNNGKCCYRLKNDEVLKSVDSSV